MPSGINFVRELSHVTQDNTRERQINLSRIYQEGEHLAGSIDHVHKKTTRSSCRLTRLSFQGLDLLFKFYILAVILKLYENNFSCHKVI